MGGKTCSVALLTEVSQQLRQTTTTEQPAASTRCTTTALHGT